MYDSEEEIERLVRDFESCTIAAADFHHREHLVVAVWYLQTLSPPDAVARMRSALRRFIDHHGVDPKKYSEEVTVFWIQEVARELERMGSETQLVDKTNQIISRFSSRAHKPAAPVAGVE